MYWESFIRNQEVANQQSAANCAATIQNQKSKRPFSVTLVALAVLTFAVIHLVRLVDAILQWDFLKGLEGVPVAYIALSGLLWALVGLPLAWGLWRGKRWAPIAARIALPAYLLYAWIDRIFIANAEITMSGDSAWPFMAGATLVSMALLFWNLSRAKARAFYRRNG